MPKKSKNTKQLEPVIEPAAPVIPPIAFTTKQWKGNPALQRELRQLLDNPVMKMAFQSILVTAMPNAQPVAELLPGVSAEAVMLRDANRYHHRSGMAQFYRALRNLACETNEPKRQPEWGQLEIEDE